MQFSALQKQTLQHSSTMRNTQCARPIQYILQQLGHTQPPTPMKIDSATANTFIHQTMRHKQSLWDMRYWWSEEKSTQSEFNIFWDKGVNNWADYVTEHFAPSVYQVLRQRSRTYTKTNLILSTIQTTFSCHISARMCQSDPILCTDGHVSETMTCTDFILILYNQNMIITY